VDGNGRCHRIPHYRGPLIAYYDNARVQDIGGIVALRNHADALIECAVLLLDIRNDYQHHDCMSDQCTACDIDAALARLEGSEK
jgi:hypothetical protein